VAHPQEDVSDIVTACQQLKASGCPIIVDISMTSSPAENLIGLADIIKVDMTDHAAAISVREAFAEACYLATNVNSAASFDQAADLGFHYFHGDFYSKPSLPQATGVPFSKLNHLLLLQQINRPDISFDKLAGIIKRDVGLSYKLMRYINSAHFGFPGAISSLRHALALMGVVHIKHWLCKETLHEIGKNKPDELFINAIVRGRFGELLAEKAACQQHASEIFLTGLFSRLDAFLDRGLGVILKDLPVSDNIRNTLLGNHSDFIDLYRLILAYERGEWGEVNNLAEMVGLQPSDLPVTFIRALEWSQQMFADG
jgi:EAL and modified HD-GYP domain-containing signal transduction protein